MKERGYLLGLLFFLPIVAVFISVLFAGLMSGSDLKSLQMAELLAVKNALIAYAATDTERPGRLPCTADLEGEAQLFVRNVCPEFFGRLPWKTLDLGVGNGILYVLDGNFSGDFQTSKTLNANTRATLTMVDAQGIQHKNLAAILAVPKIAQTFTEQPMIDLRDSRWRFAVGISADELLHAASRHVANTLAACFRGHTQKETLPAPAPFSAENEESLDSARFGRVPNYAQNAGISAILQNFFVDFESQNISLLTTESDEVDAFSANLKTLDESLYAANLYANQAFNAYKNVNAAAKNLQKSANTLAATISRTTNGKSENKAERVSASVQRNVIKNGEALLSYYETLAQRFWQTGFAAPSVDFAAWQDVFDIFKKNAPQDKTVTDLAFWQTLFNLLRATQNLAAWSDEILKITEENAVLARKSTTATARQENADSLYSQSAALRTALEKAQTALSNFQKSPTATRRKNLLKAAQTLNALKNNFQNLLKTAQSQMAGGTAHFWPMIWASASCDFLNTWWAKEAWRGTIFYQNNAEILGRGKKPWAILAAGAPLQNQNRAFDAPQSYFEDCNNSITRADSAQNPDDKLCALPKKSNFNDILAW